MDQVNYQDDIKEHKNSNNTLQFAFIIVVAFLLLALISSIIFAMLEFQKNRNLQNSNQIFQNKIKEKEADIATINKKSENINKKIDFLLTLYNGAINQPQTSSEAIAMANQMMEQVKAIDDPVVSEKFYAVVDKTGKNPVEVIIELTSYILQSMKID